MPSPRRVVLKVDVDTYRGTLEGIPRLLDLFARERIRATFFFSLGPDETGKAIRRIFKKGFLKKVLKSNPAASYGLRTMLYGTLLPAPDIGASPPAIARMREVRAAGHECGIHAWNHVDWHDRLVRMNRPEVESIVALCRSRFLEVFGEQARLSAAPGWTATPLSVEVQEASGIRVTSDTRGGTPFYPRRTDGAPAAVLEIPSTLPTLDELLAWDEFSGSDRERQKTVPFLRDAVKAAEALSVHSVHTEIEGGRALHGLFASQIQAWKEIGVVCVPLGEAAVEAGKEAPVRSLGWNFLPGRATPVATQIQ